MCVCVCVCLCTTNSLSLPPLKKNISLAYWYRYPCMLGIPIMPAIFAYTKVYLFFGFVLVGGHALAFCINVLL